MSKKKCFQFLFCLAVMLIFGHMLTFDNKVLAEADSTTVTLLKNKCIQCHGAEKDGKKKVKGDIDIAAMIKTGIHVSDTEKWAKVVDTIESGDMPPEDSEIKMSANEKTSLISQLRSILNVKTIEERMLTPQEFKRSMDELFGVDSKSYNAFKRLEFNQDPIVRYPTIDSERLMSVNLIEDLNYGLDSIMRQYVLFPDKNKTPSSPLPEKFSTEIWPERKKDGGGTAVVFIDQLMSKLKNKPKKKTSVPRPTKKSTPEELKAYKKQQNSNKPAKKELDKLLVGLGRSFDLRKQKREVMGLNYGKQFIHKNTPTGKYRLTFKAVALNRHKVAEAYEKYGKTNDKNKEKTLKKFEKINWEPLINEKMRLGINLFRTSTSNFRGADPNTIRGAKLATIEIEDNVVKTYTIEFELRNPNSITFNWINGPFFQNMNFLTLPGEKYDTVKARSGPAGAGRAGREYDKPCIRFEGPIKMERISYIRRNKYEIMKTDSNDEESIRAKVLQYIKELGLEQYKSNLITLFDELPKNLNLYNRYTKALKYISMSPENIYINLTGNLDDDARFVSYSLLKEHPNKTFKSKFSSYRSGKMTSSEFADYVVNNPDFKGFVDEFTSKWIGYEVKLDEAKYSEVLRSTPFNEETKNYIHHIFKNNRPVIELFDSDYKVINHTLSKYYKLPFKNYDNDNYKAVKTPTQRGGIINQQSFYIANSSGVDPLPFRRANWIVENVFDIKLPPPPNNVNVEEFSEAKETKSFKESTLMHAENKQCQGCHSKIDPIAFAMNNFDTVGERIIECDKESENVFRKRLSGANTTMAKAFTRHMISYILGRNTTVFDTTIINKIVSNTEKEQYAVKSILANIIDAYFKK